MIFLEFTKSTTTVLLFWIVFFKDFGVLFWAAEMMKSVMFWIEEFRSSVYLYLFRRIYWKVASFGFFNLPFKKVFGGYIFTGSVLCLLFSSLILFGLCIPIPLRKENIHVWTLYKENSYIRKMREVSLIVKDNCERYYFQLGVSVTGLGERKNSSNSVLKIG